MRLRSVFAIAFAVSSLGFSVAASADGYAGSIKDAPLPTPIRYEWSGLSVGAGIGAGKIDTQVKAKAWRKEIVDKKKCYFEPAPGPKIAESDLIEKCIDQYAPDSYQHTKASGDDDDWNFFGTVQIGYDRRLGDRILIGAFADIDFYKDADLALENKHGRRNSLSGKIDRDTVWTIGGRLGFLATERILIYGLAGYSQLNLDGELSAQFGDPAVRTAPAHIGMNIDKWVGGYTVGGGIEAKLEQRVSLKLEYRYSAFDGASMKTGSMSTDSWTGEDPGVRYLYERTIKEGAKMSISDTDIHSVRAVLSFKLGGHDEPLSSLK
jgi:outer membrane immunogenic protein